MTVGNSEANDIEIDLQTFKGDDVSLPFFPEAFVTTSDSINWRISIRTVGSCRFLVHRKIPVHGQIG